MTLADVIRDRMDRQAGLGQHVFARRAVLAVLHQHQPYAIYGDCGHDHQPGSNGLPEHVMPVGDGFSCRVEVVVCGYCCRSSWDGGQSDECADNHDHSGGVHCFVVEVIAEAFGVEPASVGADT